MTTPAPVADRVRLRAPWPVLVATALAVLAAAYVLVVCTWWLVESGAPEVLVYTGIPSVLAVSLLVGAVRLGTGRSWLATLLPAAAFGLSVAWWLSTETAFSAEGRVQLSVLCAGCAATALLSAAPSSRRWTAAPRAARRTGDLVDLGAVAPTAGH